jgi:hypothetical protein
MRNIRNKQQIIPYGKMQSFLVQVEKILTSKLAGKFAKLCFMLIETVRKQRFLGIPYL